MKEPIEDLFKKSLEGHEMSYRPEAWSAMSARLDATQPLATPRSYKRYYIAAAGIGIAAIVSYFIFNNGSNETVAQTQIVQNDNSVSEATSSEKMTKGQTNSGSETKTTTPSKSTDLNNTTSSTSGATTSSSGTATSSGTETNGNESSTATSSSSNTSTTSTSSTASSSTPSTTSGSEHIAETPKQMIVPAIRDLCLNEAVLIENKNDRKIMVLAPNGTITAINPRKALNYQPNMVGMHGIGFLENDDFYSESTFSVHGTPEADFSIDDINKFQSGIPTSHVVAGTSSDTYVWKANGQTVNGSEADLHFYKKGKQNISLTVSNEVCTATAIKSVFIEDDYNLMAVSAFTPLGNDPRNITFMPFALTERNVNFNMVIIDSKDGGVVYETSDSDQPWDGTDMRSGERNRGITTYIWKVVLYNPELNEPAEYIGTVTKL